MFDFHQADFVRLNSYLSNVNWNGIFESTNDVSSAFKDVVFNICHLCVPCKTPVTSENKPRGKLKCIQGLKRKKKKLMARIKAIQQKNPMSSFIPSLLNKVDLINTNIKQSILNFNEKSELKAIARIKDNPSYFYSFVKKKSKKRSKIGPLKNPDGNILSLIPLKLLAFFRNNFVQSSVA